MKLKAITSSILMAAAGYFVSWIFNPPKPAVMVRHAIRAVTLIRSKGPDGFVVGSGFFIADNLVVTSHHVIEGLRGIVVETYTGKKFRVLTVVAASRKKDFAVLKIAAHAPLKLRPTTQTHIGDDVYTLGAPMGMPDSVSKGIVSQFVRGPAGEALLQHTAPISPGSSGGPLLDVYGDVIGINNFSFVIAQNINFALDIGTVMQAIGEPRLRRNPGMAKAITDLVNRLVSRIAIEREMGKGPAWQYFLKTEGEGIRRPID